MKIDNTKDAEQLIRILPILHDNGIKIIMLANKTNNEIKTLLLKEINNYSNEKYTPKLTSRLNILD